MIDLTRAGARNCYFRHETCATSVTEYVRVGIRTADLLRTSAETDGDDTVEFLTRTNAALEASLSVVEHERKELLERIGRLEGELTSARQLADDREHARAAFTTAVAAADALRRQIVATREGGAITGEERLREHMDAAYGAIASTEAEGDGARGDDMVAVARSMVGLSYLGSFATPAARAESD